MFPLENNGFENQYNFQRQHIMDDQRVTGIKRGHQFEHNGAASKRLRNEHGYNKPRVEEEDSLNKAFPYREVLGKLLEVCEKGDAELFSESISEIIRKLAKFNLLEAVTIHTDLSVYSKCTKLNMSEAANAALGTTLLNNCGIGLMRPALIVLRKINSFSALELTDGNEETAFSYANRNPAMREVALEIQKKVLTLYQSACAYENFDEANKIKNSLAYFNINYANQPNEDEEKFPG